MYFSDVQNGGYSFTLRLSKEDGCWCSVCPWYRFCRGCPLIPSDQPFSMASDTLVIDWEPAFYHLRYQESLEFVSTLTLFVCLSLALMLLFCRWWKKMRVCGVRDKNSRNPSV